MLIERCIGRRSDPVTGKIPNLQLYTLNPELPRNPCPDPTPYDSVTGNDPVTSDIFETQTLSPGPFTLDPEFSTLPKPSQDDMTATTHSQIKIPNRNP